MSLQLNYPGYLLFFIAAAALISLFLKPLSKFLLLRLAAYCLLFLLLFRPVIETGISGREDLKINVYVDNSRSMSVENRYGDALKVAENLYEELGQKANLEFFTFSGTAEKIDFRELLSSRPEGDKTNLSSVLQGDTPHGRILISDGVHNYGANPLGSKELSALPLFTRSVGSDYEIPDLAIEAPRVPPVAYRGEETPVSFILSNAAGSAGRVNVYLKKNESIVASENIELGRRKNIPMEFKFTPSEAGIKEYSLEVDRIEGEINRVNNRRSFQLNVHREKIRILYVSGQPSWEYSFLRRLLKSDPKVELVSFLILRNPRNVTIVPEEELSLIHFPAREMFTREIYNFDLLFYDNFSYERFFPTTYLNHIKYFVEKGGAFIMMGGEDSYGRGGYAGTAVEEILPVNITRDSEWIREKIDSRPAGDLNHPLLALAADRETSARIWDGFPHLEGYDPSLRAREGSELLLKSENDLPLLVAGTYGAGRVIAFNSNSTWRWAMGLSSKGRGPHYYNRFWQNLLRYAVQAPESEKVRIFPERETAVTGESLEAGIRVLESDFTPASGANVQLTLKDPENEKIILPPAAEGEREGWYSSRLELKSEGSHILAAEAFKDGRLLGSAETEIRAVTVDREMEKLSPNRELLRHMAARSGGVYFQPGEEMDPEKIFNSLNRHIEAGPEAQFPWHWPGIFFLLLLITAGEWFLQARN